MINISLIIIFFIFLVLLAVVWKYKLMFISASRNYFGGQSQNKNENIDTANVILPVTLFDPYPLPIAKTYIVEDKYYFGTDRRIEKFNKLKLILHRASMKYYFDLLEAKKIDVEYIENSHSDKWMQKIYDDGFKQIRIIDPIDHDLMNDITSNAKKLGIKVLVYDNPGFILTNEDLDNYMKSAKQNHFSQTSFYIWHRKKNNLLLDNNGKPLGGKWSYDKYNRKKMPSDVSIPSLPKFNNEKYVKSAIEYVESNFANHYGHDGKSGSQAGNFYLPITHQQADEWLDDFIKNKFIYFSDYQDYMLAGEPFLFHSVLTPAMNIGLITPSKIIQKIIKLLDVNNPDSIRYCENIIRQIAGWREFSRMLYKYKRDDMKKNYFDAQNKLNSDWYTASTGIEPLDDAIKMAWKYGYIHHILRLMIVGSSMLMKHIHPDEVYKWFMEFSVDSYDWVMTNNVYSMSQYSDGGLTTTKPYISGSNYILNMSNYSNSAWTKKYDDMYYGFLLKHRDKLENNPRMKLMYYIIDKSN